MVNVKVSDVECAFVLVEFIVRDKVVAAYAERFGNVFPVEYENNYPVPQYDKPVDGELHELVIKLLQ